MLYELNVENIALIRRMRLALEEGMNALTGETGAGKSMVIDAISLLLGARGSDMLIRQGADRAVVEGVFLPPFPAALAEMLGEDAVSDTLILSRELVRGGRSVARLNGRAVTLAQLRAVGRLLVNIHGQREHTLLMEEEEQGRLLDCYGGEDCLFALKRVRDAYQVLHEAKTRVQEYTEQRDQRVRRMDELQQIIGEIEEAAPRPDEMDALREEAHLLAHGEKLYQFAEEAHEALYCSRGAVEQLGVAATALRQAAALDTHCAALADRLNSLYYEAEDVANEIISYRDRVNIDAFRQEEVEARIALLRRLEKKYGDLLVTLAACQKEYASLEEIDESGELFRQQAELAEAEYSALSEQLHERRAAAALALSNEITHELHLLAMPGAEFQVELLPCAPSPAGTEHARFMIRTNPGESMQPVSQIASGGELSRIVLGVKVILAQLDAVPTLIFDEIDTGMSGRALVSVAERVALVSRHAQTILVTHAAAMAAAADRQILIEKHEEDGRTVISAQPLTEEERVADLARMIAGDHAGETTLQQAREMLRQMHDMIEK